MRNWESWICGKREEEKIEKAKTGMDGYKNGALALLLLKRRMLKVEFYSKILFFMY